MKGLKHAPDPNRLLGITRDIFRTHAGASKRSAKNINLNRLGNALTEGEIKEVGTLLGGGKDDSVRRILQSKIDDSADFRNIINKPRPVSSSNANVIKNTGQAVDDIDSILKDGSFFTDSGQSLRGQGVGTTRNINTGQSGGGPSNARKTNRAKDSRYKLKRTNEFFDNIEDYRAYIGNADATKTNMAGHNRRVRDTKKMADGTSIGEQQRFLDEEGFGIKHSGKNSEIDQRFNAAVGKENYIRRGADNFGDTMTGHNIPGKAAAGVGAIYLGQSVLGMLGPQSNADLYGQ